MTQRELLDRLEADLRTLLEEVRARFAQLSAEAVAHRPHPEDWNIAEVFAHLNMYASDYLPRMELAIHKAKARQWTVPANEIKYTARGRRAIKRANPDNGKTYKSSKRYDFHETPLSPDLVKSFIINAERLLRILQAARNIDLNRVYIKKANSWMARYTLGNMLEFQIVHMQRHVRQAQRCL